MRRAVADHLRAIAVFRGVLSRVSGRDLERPTPCGNWTVRQLLGHQLGQDLAFTAALRGGADRAADWAPAPIGDDGPAALQAALDRQEVALGGWDDRAGAVIWMPEIVPGAPLPAERALAAHQIDLVVHAWDLAASLGIPVDVPDDLLAQCLAVARAIPDTDQSRAPGSAFARGLAVPAGAGPLDEVLRRLGRDPYWAPPRSGL